MGEISCSNDSIQLGYSASVCGNDLYRPLPGKSTLQIFSSTNSVSGASFFSKPSTVATNKHRKRENLEKWKIEPVLGWNAVRLVGLRCRDKKLKHTSLIKWRMQSRCILTDSGSIYTLVGPMQRSPNIPDSIYQAFEHGFPNNWKQIVRDYLQIIHERNCGSSSEHESEFPVTNTVLSATLPDNLTEEPEMQVILPHTPSNHNLQDILETPAVKRNKIKIIAKKNRNSSFNNSSHDVLETPAPKAKRKTIKKARKEKEREEKDTISKTLKMLPKYHADLCSPNPSGLFRTRSGRHVFPPLQRWTGQRLSLECDKDGKEVVQFYPGNKSSLILDVHSPAAEALRTSEGISRQFMFNQSCKKLEELPLLRRQRKCVKNLLKPKVSDKPEEQVMNDKSPSVPHVTNKSAILPQVTNKSTSAPVINPNRRVTRSCCVSVTPLKISDENNNTQSHFLRKRKKKNVETVSKKPKLALQPSNAQNAAHNPGKPQRKKSTGQSKAKKTKTASKPEKKPTRKTQKESKQPNKKKEIDKNQENEDTTVKESKPTNSVASEEAPKITARKGTLKYRRQVQEFVKDINIGKNQQDFFNDNSVAHDMFGESMGLDAFDQSMGTPAKGFLEFSKYVKTPPWFKTPQAQKYDQAFPDTPDYLKSSVPRPTEYPKADQVVFQMQKILKKKTNKKLIEMDAHKPTKVGMKDIKGLLREPVEEDVNSSDEDDYFSE